MGKIFKRDWILILAVMLLFTACGEKTSPEESDDAAWLKEAALDASETPDELYQKALEEDILIVYTVSTRVSDTKEAFEEAYPGLSVEIRDLRSPSLIEAVEYNYSEGLGECDVVLCNDNSGDFKSRLVDTGIVVPYLPEDIAVHMKEKSSEGMVSFLNEAEILMYNTARYDSCPIENIWELTEEKYKGQIYMPNPLRSFSTYAFCASSFEHEEEMKAAYRSYAGEELDLPEGESATEVFWKELSPNVIFTNSSDEVIEALGNDDAAFGIAVSSKLRYKSVGYDIDAVYKLEPFCGCRTSFAVMIAKGAKNVNAAKLFIRFLLGEEDGTGPGYEPFRTVGTWSVREDVPDGNPVAQDDIDLITPDQDFIIENKSRMEDLWTEILKDNTADG